MEGIARSKTTKIAAVACAAITILVLGGGVADAHTRATVRAHCIRDWDDPASVSISTPPGVRFFRTGRRGIQKVFFRADFYQHYPLANQGQGRTVYVGSSELFHNFLRRNQRTRSNWYNERGQVATWTTTQALRDPTMTQSYVKYHLWWYQRGRLVHHDLIHPWHDYLDGQSPPAGACAWAW